ncbi:hypothetical protein N7468_010431 [Penicillium chermesinum]|uniref:DJ-1/PfpI domain-containing protein n=1 Tax=Penicillium chermesinum TaxID=63820 RepID=A0A9W9NCQ2_9EURO|nr:uncharacterized protein N7468_010431 [Penicillium chermesinum]KAJ5217423.1 hypothetical protein N7468_010431 [Penicillium chermesinum]
MLKLGLILFEGFQALDAFGPLDCINVLSRTESVSLALLASTLEPVSTRPAGFPSSTGQHVVPTHTFAEAPDDLDVLLVPGGQGTRGSDAALLEAIAFIQKIYPRLQYLITVCTGAGLVARAGVLDGKKATTNKKAFTEITAWRPAVQWVSRARWVVDGNIWTSSGVSAGIDVTLAWIAEVYGEDKAQAIADGIEHIRQTNPAVDEFASLYGL